VTWFLVSGTLQRLYMKQQREEGEEEGKEGGDLLREEGNEEQGPVACCQSIVERLSKLRVTASCARYQKRCLAILNRIATKGRGCTGPEVTS
jgi:hypothetical protein